MGPFLFLWRIEGVIVVSYRLFDLLCVHLLFRCSYDNCV